MSSFIDSLISKHFQNPECEEVFINGCYSMQVYSKKRIELEAPIQNRDELENTLQEFSLSQGKRLDPLVPFSGGVYQDCYRWHILIAPLARDGALLSIRRHQFHNLSINELDPLNIMSQKLKQAIENQNPIFFFGETGSGKTSMISAVLNEYFKKKRVFIIEQISEISLSSKSWVRLESRAQTIDKDNKISVLQALNESLRMRPDIIVIGEVRTEEFEALETAIHVGHGSLITSIHAGNYKSLQKRLQVSTKISNIKALAIKMNRTVESTQFIHF